MFQTIINAMRVKCEQWSKPSPGRQDRNTLEIEPEREGILEISLLKKQRSLPTQSERPKALVNQNCLQL